MIDRILEILDKIEPLILVLLPALLGLWLKISTKLKEENDSFRKAERKKATEKYNVWKHEESKRVIIKIKELCRVYKDRSIADDVMFLQLENGTMASSRLCNMFFTCLAEDDRYSEIPKKIRKLQRVPYSQLGEWANTVSEHELLVPQTETTNFHIDEDFLSDVKSQMARPVFDKDGYLIGVVIFNYSKEFYNSVSGLADEKNTYAQSELLKQFQSAVESVFIAYHVSQADFKKQLGLTTIFNDNGVEEND